MHLHFAIATAMMLTFGGLAGAQEKKEPPPAKTDQAKSAEPAKSDAAAKNDTAKNDATKSDAAAKAAEPASPDSPQGKFDKLLADWRKLLADMYEAQLKYRTSKPEERPPILKKFNEMVQQGTAMEPLIKKAAEEAYLAAPNANEQVTNFVVSMMADAMKRDDYEEARRIGKMLLDHDNKSKGVNGMMSVAAFNMNDFDTAAEYLKKAEGPLTHPSGRPFFEVIPDYQAKWKKEQAIRAAEAKADDLPRVKIKTSKGDIVVELFENEAPKTVANFISLVKSGFYNGTVFHRVLPGFMAQGGGPKDDIEGGIGYTIPCECYEPNHRLHFRGTLSMAHKGRDSGGSQFFLTFLPTGHLDGLHTAFGRVIEGMDVLAKLQKRDPSADNPPEPDKIIEATVVRSRNHPYEPTKLPEK